MVNVAPSGAPEIGSTSKTSTIPDGVPSTNPSSDQDVAGAMAGQENALMDLFGSSLNDRAKPTSVHGPEVAKGVFLNYPVPLRQEEIAAAPGAPPPNFDDAVTKAKANPDIETVFFVNFAPGGLTGDALKNLQDLQSQVRSWQAWSSTLSEGELQEQIDKKILPDDNSGPSMAKRSSYRSKVFDFLMRRSAWYASRFHTHNLS